MPKILAIDPSFTATGIVVCDLANNRIVHSEVIETAPSARKRGIRVADDDAERCANIAASLQSVAENWNIVGAVVELPSGSQNARSARTLGMVAGVVVTFLTLNKIPAEWVTPNEVKMAAVGRANASKADVQDAVRAKFNWSGHWPKTKGRREHVADAAGAILAARGGTLLTMVERMVG